jgi:Txe/YoeB family toxin of toxin-antitoxin system
VHNLPLQTCGRQLLLFFSIINYLISVRNNLSLGNARATPFEGLDKQEALKGDLKSYWSRRINEEHRIVILLQIFKLPLYHFVVTINFETLFKSNIPEISGTIRESS